MTPACIVYLRMSLAVERAEIIQGRDAATNLPVRLLRLSVIRLDPFVLPVG